MRKKLIRHMLVICLTTGLIDGVAVAGDDEPTIYGWLEKVTIEEPWGPEVKAKLDSGALTSSIQAEDIEEFERDEEDWVRFVVEVEDEATGDVVAKTFERPVHRNLVLSGTGGEDHRPAVLMTICLGGTRYQEQFSLEDRDDLNYPVLLGRRTIQDLGGVDVTETFLHDPECGEDSPLQKHEDKELDEDIGI